MNPEDRSIFILSQLNAGLRTEWSQVEGLETNLEKLLGDARTRADSHIPAAQRRDWDQSWNEVREHLAEIRSSAAEARRHHDAGESADAVNSWSNLIEHDLALDHLLDTVRTTGREAVLPLGDSDPWYDSWKLHWMDIDDHLATLRAHAVTTRFRLEMRQEYGETKGDALTKEILDRLPQNASLEEAEKYAAEYRQAHREFEKHREHPTIRDIIRGLFLFPEENAEDFHQEHLRKQRHPARSKEGETPSVIDELSRPAH